MRIARTATALAATVVLLAACAEESGSTGVADPPAADSSPTTAQEWAGETIPDGTYARTATMADVERLGLPKDRAREFLGKDGESHYELRIEADDWAQFGDFEDAAMTQGDGGTATYDAEGNWVVTSPGCGCVSTMGWQFDEDQLTLKMLDTTESGDPVELLIARLVMEGKWTRR